MASAKPVKVLDPLNTHLTIVGCGGTGSFLLKNVCRLLWGLKEQRRAAYEAPRMLGQPFGQPPREEIPEVMLCDGDVVERKNVIRQDFVPTDVGRPKALVLAERYSAAYGVTVRAYPRYLGRDTDLARISPEGGVVAGCVDNAPTRRLLHEQLSRYHDVVYLDSGNAGVEVSADETREGRLTRSEQAAARGSGWDGQVLCGVRKGGEGMIPFPAEAMPDLIEPGEAGDERLPDEVPCGEVIESLPQRQMTNLLAATMMMSYLTTLLSEGTLLHSRSFFCARRGYVKSYPAMDELDEVALA